MERNSWKLAQYRVINKMLSQADCIKGSLQVKQSPSLWKRAKIKKGKSPHCVPVSPLVTKIPSTPPLVPLLLDGWYTIDFWGNQRNFYFSLNTPCCWLNFYRGLSLQKWISWGWTFDRCLDRSQLLQDGFPHCPPLCRHNWVTVLLPSFWSHLTKDYLLDQENSLPCAYHYFLLSVCCIGRLWYCIFCLWLWIKDRYIDIKQHRILLLIEPLMRN